MKRTGALLLALALMISATRAEAGASDPAAVTKAAYHTAMAHFGFSPDTLRHEKPYLAPDLYAALMKKANQPVPKGDAPDIEGDVLLDAQDLPTHLKFGPASVDGAKATVTVMLLWDSEGRRYQVSLVRLEGAWKITNVDYGKEGKLTDLLK